MPYLIDSDIVIDHLANVLDTTKLLETLASEGIAISIITYFYHLLAKMRMIQ